MLVTTEYPRRRTNSIPQSFASWNFMKMANVLWHMVWISHLSHDDIICIIALL